MVFLHSFGGSGKAWAQVAESLGEGWRCVMPDLRGFGDSDTLPASYVMADAADDVLNLVDALGLERYALVGHSMGGKIAMAIAARQPPGLVQLVLLAPSPPSPEPIAADERTHLLDSYSNRAAAEAATRESSGRPLTDALFLQAVNDRLRTSHAAWRWWLLHGSKENICSALAAIAVPSLVLHGTLDKNISSAVIEQEVMPRLPRARLQTLQGFGHLLPLETPQLIAQAIVQAFVPAAPTGSRKSGLASPQAPQPPQDAPNH